MNPVQNSLRRGTLRALAGAAVSACLVATIGLVSSSAAEPTAAPTPQGSADMHAQHEAMGEHWSQHVQAHLDKLAERLEIKASQEPAWQKFSAAFRDTMQLHPGMGHPGMERTGMSGAGRDGSTADAATLARQQADRAKDHAQKLAQLAEATAGLQQSLSADQRQVFNEAARHFAREHGGHGGMGPMAEGGYHGAMGEHCERDDGHGDYAHPHGHGEHMESPDGSMMEPHHESAEPQGETAH